MMLKEKIGLLILSLLFPASMTFAQQMGSETLLPGVEATPLEETQKSEEKFGLNPHRPIVFSATKCLGKNPNGYGVKRYLFVQYPWSKIQNSSIEIRIAGKKAKETPQFCKPMYFMTQYAPIELIHEALIGKNMHDSRFVNNVEFPKSIFTELRMPEPELVLANIKNLSGEQGVFFHSRLANPETKELETTLIFPKLSQWAVDNDRLVLDLRGKLLEFDKGKREFEQPCELKIWFLKDDFVVWEQTIQWPGTEKDNPTDKKGTKKGSQEEKDPMEEASEFEISEKSKDTKGAAEEENSEPEEEFEEEF